MGNRFTVVHVMIKKLKTEIMFRYFLGCYVAVSDLSTHNKNTLVFRTKTFFKNESNLILCQIEVTKD